MTNFDILLWDVDGTLLDFAAAEEAAIRALFSEFGIGICTDEMLSRYSAINKKYWERLERGEMTKPEILVGRFEEFFKSEGLDSSIAEDFNDRYQLGLGDTIAYCDDSYELVSSLKGKIPQYVVSNGTVIAQTKKLERSGFDKLMDGIFLSDDLGYEKPRIEFFDIVMKAIGEPEKERVLIVGDSLTSDILGGNTAGIKTCFYNPKELKNNTKAVPDYEVKNLREVIGIL